MRALFINACTRENSRTKMIADYLISKLKTDVIEIDLYKEDIKSFDSQRLAQRDRALLNNDISAEILKYAVQFSESDVIVIAAPYWDLSFPSVLKVYIENITAVGVTFDYDETGKPFGKCKAKSLYYVTTSGGYIYNDAFGYGYIQQLCKQMYGIDETYCIDAQGLDIQGADVEELLNKAKQHIDMFIK